MKLQKLGGYAAIASLFLTMAYELLAIFLKSRTAFTDSPVKAMTANLAMPTEFYAMALLLIVSSIIGFMWALALHKRMHANAPYLTRIMLIAFSAYAAMKIAESFLGFQITAVLAPMQDLSAFKAFTSVIESLHNASNHIFGWYVVFLGCAVLRTHAFSQAIGWLFLLEGILLMAEKISFILGLISALASVVAIVWIGVAMLRQKQIQPAAKEMAVTIYSPAVLSRNRKPGNHGCQGRSSL
jgi:hypothetical protein